MPLRFATYNAGLAVGVLPLVTERLPLVIDALAALEVDILFVQELWLDAHWAALRAHVVAQWPHALRPEPERRLFGEGAGGCRAEDVAPFIECANKHCPGLKDEALAQCVVSHCASIGLSLAPPCLNCLAAHPVGTIDEIVGRCLTPDDQVVTGQTTETPTGLLAYGGSFGTGLLSRYPLLDRATITYESTINARGAVHARIELENEEVEHLHVFGTHFSPGGAEQEPQVERFVEWIADRAGDDAPIVVLGDLNMTKGSHLFRRLEAIGLREPDDADPRGTYSSAGLGTGHVGTSSWRIDHVLTRGLGRVRSQRILDEPVTVTVGGRRVRTTLSDHFGVLASSAGYR